MKVPDQPRSSDGTFLLTSPAVEDGAELPVEFTGDGDGVTPPLGWRGGEGTRAGPVVSIRCLT